MNRRVACFLLVALSAVVPGAPPVAAESARSLAREGYELFEQERWQEAIDKYTQAIQREPDSPLIQYNFGTALARIGRFAEAVQVLQDAAEGANALNSDAWFNLGVMWAQKTFSEHPEVGSLLEWLQGRPEEEWRDAVNSLPPTEVEAVREGLKAARDAFRQALLRRPDDEEARRNFEVTREILRRLEQDPQPQPNVPNDQGNENQDNDSNEQQNQQSGGQSDQENPDPQSGDGGDEQQDSSDEQNDGNDPESDPDEQEQDPPSDGQNSGQKDGQNNEQPGGSPPPAPGQGSGNPLPNRSGLPMPFTPQQLDALRLLQLLDEEDPGLLRDFLKLEPSGPQDHRREW